MGGLLEWVGNRSRRALMACRHDDVRAGRNSTAEANFWYAGAFGLAEVSLLSNYSDLLTWRRWLLGVPRRCRWSTAPRLVCAVARLPRRATAGAPVGRWPHRCGRHQPRDPNRAGRTGHGARRQIDPTSAEVRDRERRPPKHSLDASIDGGSSRKNRLEPDARDIETPRSRQPATQLQRLRRRADLW